MPMSSDSDSNTPASPDNLGPVDEETAEDVQQSLEESDEDVTRSQRWAAGIQLTLLFGGIGAAGAAAVATGIVDPQVTLQATVDVGQAVELLVYGFVALFLLYVLTLIIIWLPGSVLGALGGVAFGLAKSAGYIDDDTDSG